MLGFGGIMEKEKTVQNIKKILLENRIVEFMEIEFNYNIKMKPFANKNYYIVGNCMEVYDIGIDEVTMEVGILNKDENKIDFINSSLEKLINCIKCVRQTQYWEINENDIEGIQKK
jgi:hypothetical protein